MEKVNTANRTIQGLTGFALYTLALGLAVYMLPAEKLDPASASFLIALGSLAVWRYSWGLVHFARAGIFRKLVFPQLRRQADKQGNSLMPSHVYLLVTSYRIQTETTIAVFKSVIEEAIACGIPTTIVASIVELGDELLIKDLFKMANPPEQVKLQLVRIPGTGKRAGLAQGFRAISRDMPDSDALVAVIDGDCILQPGTVRKCAPFFKMMPNLGALTTDEDCEVEGSRIMSEWHSLRFAQRHVLMSSMSLSKKVLTLTGRMSMFRADIITDADFIAHVEDDSISHWRLGHFRFLTGDDKSSWFWVLRAGYEMLYVPDVIVRTVEHPPSDNFFIATTILMRRWFGNMLRINGSALRLGPARTGLFTWWCILDQRISMWTSLTGPTFALFLTVKHSIVFLPAYLVWIGLTRWVMTVMLLTARPVLSWYYPFLIYYNQLWGSCIKTYVLFRLDRQSWTRQKTKLNRNMGAARQVFMNGTSVAMHGIAVMAFVTIIGLLAGLLKIPTF
jgi:glycosyltransferase Alg8